MGYPYSLVALYRNSTVKAVKRMVLDIIYPTLLNSLRRELLVYVFGAPEGAVVVVVGREKCFTNKEKTVFPASDKGEFPTVQKYPTRTALDTIYPFYKDFLYLDTAAITRTRFREVLEDMVVCDCFEKVVESISRVSKRKKVGAEKGDAMDDVATMLERAGWTLSSFEYFERAVRDRRVIGSTVLPLPVCEWIAIVRTVRGLLRVYPRARQSEFAIDFAYDIVLKKTVVYSPDSFAPLFYDIERALGVHKFLRLLGYRRGALTTRNDERECTRFLGEAEVRRVFNI